MTIKKYLSVTQTSRLSQDMTMESSLNYTASNELEERWPRRRSHRGQGLCAIDRAARGPGLARQPNHPGGAAPV